MSEDQSPTIGPYLVATADRSVWPAGAIITGGLIVTNPAVEGRVAFRTGSPALGTLATHSGTPVGNNNRPHRGAGRRIDLAPGEAATFRFICASSNLDSAQGTTLPSGDYLLTVYLRWFSEPTRGRLEAPLVPIRLE